MADALGAAGLPQLFASTLQTYEKTLADNVLLSHPTLEMFKKYMKNYNGGRGIVIPIRAAKLLGTAYTDESGTHSTDVSNDLIGNAVFEWADEIITPFRVKHRDQLMNSGPEQIVNLVKEYIAQAEAAHGEFIVAELWKETSTGNQLLSLQELVRASDKTGVATAKLIGGIRGGVSTQAVVTAAIDTNVATVTFAGAHDYIIGDSVVVAGATTTTELNGTFTVTAVAADSISYAVTHANVADGAETGTVVCATIKDIWRATELDSAEADEDILKAMRRLVNTIYKNSRKRPDLLIADFLVYEEIESFLQDKGRYNLATDTKAQLRFTSLVFDGLEVRLDPDAPEGTLWAFSTPSLRLGTLSGEFMKAYPGDRIEGKLDEVIPLASTLVVGCAMRRENGVLRRTYA